MKMNQITEIVRQEIRKKGITYEERKSITSNSVYFKMYYNSNSLMFRISDHKTKCDVITLRSDFHTKKESVSGFVLNRIADLKKRSVKALLGVR